MGTYIYLPKERKGKEEGMLMSVTSTKRKHFGAQYKINQKKRQSELNDHFLLSRTPPQKQWETVEQSNSTNRHSLNKHTNLFLPPLPTDPELDFFLIAPCAIISISIFLPPPMSSLHATDLFSKDAVIARGVWTVGSFKSCREKIGGKLIFKVCT